MDPARNRGPIGAGKDSQVPVAPQPTAPADVYMRDNAGSPEREEGEYWPDDNEHSENHPPREVPKGGLLPGYTHDGTKAAVTPDKNRPRRHKGASQDEWADRGRPRGENPSLERRQAFGPPNQTDRKTGVDQTTKDEDRNSSPPRQPAQPRRGRNPDQESEMVENGEDGDHDTDNESSNDVDADNEDRFKPEGTVCLEIDRFSDFARGLPADSPQRLSDPPVYIRGMPWRILAIPREGGNRMNNQNRTSTKCLGFFLQCNGETGVDQDNWSCQAIAQLRVVSQKQGVENHQRKISHTFHPKENDWGYSQFIQCEVLLDESTGYIKNDVVRLEVDVCADAPHGVHWDSKKHAGYIGLRNQGATCYMNSILQTLFFTNKLRKAVYLMPTEDDDQDSSVALAMQRVFYELQFSESPVGTRKLTKSFGWDAVDSFLQHDVQELCRVLLDNLESKMAGTNVEDTIPKLFKGTMRSYVRCTDVNYGNSHDESFYDIQLNVKGKSNIIESFRHYTEAEILDGENMYDAGQHGMQRAEKGMRFVSFPPVLHLQLKRFQYDPQLDANVKVNDRFEFPPELNLNEFISEGESDEDYTYLLQSVLVHAGDFHGGHYVVYINTSLRSDNPRWCKFDDDVVARCPTREAVTSNYGGDEGEGAGRSCSNAYMLVYVQRNKIQDVLCKVEERDIPRHLKLRFENEKEEELNRRREREQATLSCEVTLVTDEHLVDHHGFDIGDYDAIKSGHVGNHLRIPKTSNVGEFYHKVAEVFNLSPDALRLWKYDVIYGKDEGYTTILDSHRPHRWIPYQQEGHAMMSSILEPKGDIFYVEVARPSLDSTTGRLRTALPNYARETYVLAFLKLYDPSRKKFNFHGSIVLHVEDPLSVHIELINHQLGLPRDKKINLYLEASPDHVYPIRDLQLPIRNDRNMLVDGIILIVEDAESATEENNCHVACDQMFAHMQIEAIPNSDVFATTLNSTADVFSVDVQMDASLTQFCETLGQRLDYDPKKIVLWRSTSPTERPNSFMSQEDFQRSTVHDLIATNENFMHDPRNCRPYTVYYSKIPVPFEQLEQHQHARVAVMDHKYQTREFSVFPPKDGTVADIAKGAEEFFDVLHVSTTPSQSRVFQVLEDELPIAKLGERMVVHTLAPIASAALWLKMRVEEVPADQMNLGENEFLLPVSHYEKEPSKMFGVPFLIKVVNDEPVSNIKARVKEVLEVPDREFEKFKFNIIIGNRIMWDLDHPEHATINLTDLRNLNPNSSSPFQTPVLGIDHANKSRPMRGHHTEKAIVIHN
ncbi:Ubiquitin carboxyl-terminal hydrolase 7 [Aphelenchoides fujianensis]|nr:Ubiquitin carboxyl-terminal hydrolase 7 [Aphelenchoides fujianensis]